MSVPALCLGLSRVHRWQPATREPLLVRPSPQRRNRVPDCHFGQAFSDSFGNAAQRIRCWRRLRCLPRRKGKQSFTLHNNSSEARRGLGGEDRYGPTHNGQKNMTCNNWFSSVQDSGGFLAQYLMLQTVSLEKGELLAQSSRERLQSGFYLSIFALGFSVTRLSFPFQ